MQIIYCDCCGVKLTADNKAGRQECYPTTITQDHPILPSKVFDVEVELTFGSSVGMSRITKNNGDFCQTCLETIVIQSMLERQAKEEASVEAEEEQEDDQEPEEEADDEEEESNEEAEQGDDLDEEGEVIQEGP